MISKFQSQDSQQLFHFLARIIPVNRDADAPGVVHDVNILLFQRAVNFGAARVLKSQDASGPVRPQGASTPEIGTR